MTRMPRLVLAVENLVREFDAKLLLACVAAERGFECILGSRTRVDFMVGRFAPGIYFSKSMTSKSALMFKLLRMLGFEIVAQDEECLAYYSAEHYQAARLSPKTLPLAAHLFAWGEDSAELLRTYPGYAGAPLHVVGSPRVDLLRPELREFFADDVQRIRERFGRFVLINSSFAMVNGFFDSFNILREPLSEGRPPRLGAAAHGASPDFAIGYAAHRSTLFEEFKSMLRPLSQQFPDQTFVLRPHPSERHEPWFEAARDLPNVRVVHEGNVVPWLLAADALIHNGCTTAVEGAVIGVPLITYAPVKSDSYEAHLPDGLSYEASDLTALCDLVKRAVEARPGSWQSPAGAQALLDEYVAALSGPLASERIVDILTRDAAPRLPARQLGHYLLGRSVVFGRALLKRHIKARNPQHTHNPAYQNHRFPGVSIEDVRGRVERLQRALGRFQRVQVNLVAEHVFRVACGTVAPPTGGMR
jgi:surface carbohydrate biosynthesis protein